MIWDIGAIAASGNPGALDLFRRILLASAYVPGAFPPVMIYVELDGRHCQEMQVDGGAVAQTFLIPSVVGERSTYAQIDHRDCLRSPAARFSSAPSRC